MERWYICRHITYMDKCHNFRFTSKKWNLHNPIPEM